MFMSSCSMTAKTYNADDRFIVVFWDATRIGLHSFLFKKHISFLQTGAAALCSPSVWNAPVSLRPRLQNTQSPLIGWLTHAWTNTANINRAAVLNQVLRAKLTSRYELCKCVTWWCSVMSQSHRIKGGTTDEAFMESFFLWEKQASLGVESWHF